jgi:hypothetical protein
MVMDNRLLEIAERLKPYLRRMHLCKVAYILLRPFGSQRKTMMTLEEAEAILQQIHTGSDKSCICNNHIEECPRYDLKVIVPAYNAERFIKRCLDSILNQETKYTFQVAVTDDGSTDATSDILKEYADRITVATQENKGVATARNIALRSIDAKYIMFVDADDTIAPNTIERLLDAAYSDDADIVECAHERVSLNGKTISRHYGTTGYACGKLIRSRLFEHIQFPEGYWHEDGVIQTLVKPLARNICMTDHIGYLYTYNPYSTTSQERQQPKLLDIYWMCKIEDNDRLTLGIPDTQQWYEECLDDIIRLLSQTWRVPQSDAYAAAMMHQLHGERMRNFATSKWRLRLIEREIRAGRIDGAKLAAIML